MEGGVPGAVHGVFKTPAAETPVGQCQVMAIQEYRDWLRQTFLKLAADTGGADPGALADALNVLYDGALATAEVESGARAVVMTAKRVARLTLAAAKVSGSA